MSGRRREDSVPYGKEAAEPCRRDDKVTLLWERYRKGREYQAAQRLTTLLPRYVDFYEGRQWPPATRSTKDLPRPVVNIIKMICRELWPIMIIY